MKTLSLTPRDAAEGRDVQSGQGEDDEGQARIVGEHRGGIDDHREQAHRAAHQLAREQPRDPVVRPDPRGDVTDEPLAEERHRQGHDVLQEAA